VSQQGRKFSTRAGRKQSMAQGHLGGGGGAAPWSAGGAGYGGAYGGGNPMVLSGPVGRGLGGGPRPSMGSDSLQMPRRPSRADLAQMEVYRKMSVIGIV